MTDMPVLREVPKKLKPYLFHGVNLDWSGDREQAVADCPFCGREKKFTVNVTNGLWRCYVCGEGNEKGGGNSVTFIRSLWRMSDEAKNMKSEALTELAMDRKLLYPETLMVWGVCQSVSSRNWLVPAFDADGRLSNLYKYTQESYSSQKMRLYATPELKHQVHGMDVTDNKKRDVYICEGPWDAMALWETMKIAKRTDKGLAVTGSPSSSLLARSMIIATPGCNVIPEAIWKIIGDNDVYLMYDNDYPRENQGRRFIAGYDGMRRLVENCIGKEDKPREVHYLHWGDDGFSPELPDGYDVRDHLAKGDDETTRVQQLSSLLERLRPVPPSWVAGRSKASKPGSVDIECKPCSDFKELNNAWKKAMAPGWTKKSKQTLISMLATVLSTDAPGGSQLWLKVIGPPSCGKTTLCEALSVNKEFVVAKSTIKGFHSGYQTDKEGVEDNSLIAQTDRKTLITKDGDTLVKSKDKETVLSEARDLFDGSTRSYYKNKMSKDYENHKMTWIICGTDAMKEIDESEVGERFLDIVMMERIDDDVEDEILISVANRAARDITLDGTTTRYGPELLEAMQLTGGYVAFLRANAMQLLNDIEHDEEQLYKCTRMGKFVAFARARPSSTQDEHATREYAPRLVIQTVRMAMCATAVMNKTRIDDEVLDLLHKVTMDTSRGKGLEIMRAVGTFGFDGCESKDMAFLTNYKNADVLNMLRFLRRIEAVETFQFKPPRGMAKTRWRLTPKLRKLMREIDSMRIVEAV